MPLSVARKKRAHGDAGAGRTELGGVSFEDDPAASVGRDLEACSPAGEREVEGGADGLTRADNQTC